MPTEPYLYRRLSADQRADLLRTRKLRGLPAHEPPHYPEGRQLYLLTAACYEHAHIINTEVRRQELAEKLHQLPLRMDAWVVLPNHYHFVCQCDLALVDKAIAKLHNETATQWNREDGVVGRATWYRFVDRKIRSRSHYFASINYVHWNAVKHGYAQRLHDWKASSFGQWLDRHGRDEMVRIWKSYPVKDMGKDWDVF